MTTYNPYTNAIHIMTKAMDIGHIDPTMFEIIKNPQRRVFDTCILEIL